MFLIVNSDLEFQLIVKEKNLRLTFNNVYQLILINCHSPTLCAYMQGRFFLVQPISKLLMINDQPNEFFIVINDQSFNQ